MNDEQIKAIIEVVYHEYMYKYTGVELDSPEGKQNVSSILETVKTKIK